MSASSAELRTWTERAYAILNRSANDLYDTGGKPWPGDAQDMQALDTLFACAIDTTRAAVWEEAARLVEGYKMPWLCDVHGDCGQRDVQRELAAAVRARVTVVGTPHAVPSTGEGDG